MLIGARICADARADRAARAAFCRAAQLEERIYGWGEEVESNAVDVLIHSDPAQVREGRDPQRPGRRMDAAEILTNRVAAPHGARLCDRSCSPSSAWRRAQLRIFMPITRRRSFSTVSSARSRSTQDPAFPPRTRPPEPDQDPEDQFAVTIWDAAWTLVHASLPSVHIARQDPAGLSRTPNAGGREMARLHDRRLPPHGPGRAARSGARGDRPERGALERPRRSWSRFPLAWLVVGWAMNRVLGATEQRLPMSSPSGASARPRPSRSTGFPTEVAPLAQQHEQPHRPTS